jgi:toxin FitB
MAETASPMMIDSDIVIDHLRGVRPLPDTPLAYSVITRCELFAGRDDPAILNKVLAPLEELALTPAIAERGGDLRRETKVATPDALIAATALAHDLPLMTRNARHFGRIPDLELRAPLD